MTTTTCCTGPFEEGVADARCRRAHHSQQCCLRCARMYGRLRSPRPYLAPLGVGVPPTFRNVLRAERDL
jgi:hypothetical protein